MARRIIEQDAPINDLLGKLNKKAEEPKPKTQEPQEPKTPNKKDAPKGYKVNPLYVEKKTARVQIVLKPSTVGELKEHCKAKGLSVNEYIEGLILEALENRK